MKRLKPKKGAAVQPLTNRTPTEPTHDEIARCAYSLWEQKGRPQDQEAEIWFCAAAQLRQAKNPQDDRA